MPSKPFLALALMMRDEARTIAQTIESCAGVVDLVVLLDTGSRDGTPQIAAEMCARLRLPLKSHTAPFSDFSTPLNMLLDLAENEAEWVFRLAGDEFLRDASPAIRDTLRKAPRDVAMYALTLRIGDESLDAIRFTRSRGARYVGRVHEYLRLAPGMRDGGRIEGPWIFHSLETRDHTRAMKRFEWDLKVLSEEVALSNDPRWVFCLAQTHECLGHVSESVDWYRRRASMGGHRDTVYECWMRIGNVIDRAGLPWQEASAAWSKARDIAPERAEPLYQLALQRERQGRIDEARVLVTEALTKRFPREARMFAVPRVYETDLPALARRLGMR